MDVFEWIFIISGIIFFISMICAFILMINEKWKTVVIFGVILAVLMVPIVIVLINFIIVGNLYLIICLILIFAYLLAEFLLDRVFKIDFRSKLSQHIPYIILEWTACFSFLFGAIRIDKIIGWIMAIFFWAFVAALIYYLVIQFKKKKKNA